MLNDVKEILNIINTNNKDAFLVGGAVRDILLKKTPHDYDIATNMSYDDVAKTFPDNYDSGKAFGIITIFYKGNEYQIAHFRNDLDYEDNRHCNVELIENIEDDLKRRDFTINALAMNKEENIIDLFNGRADLENKLIRAVGKADERFMEDALRMLRAIRFSAQLNFNIEDETYEAIKNNAFLIRNVSAERIREELTKIVISDHPEKLIELYNTGLSHYILPEFDKMIECEQNNPNHIYNVGMHSIMAMKNIENDEILRFTMLLHDIGKPDVKTTKDGIDHFYNHPEESVKIANNILNRFKFSNNEKQEILFLVKNHDLRRLKLWKARYFMATHGLERLNKLRKVQLADTYAQNLDYNFEEKMEILNNFYNTCKSVYEDKTAIKLNDLKIDGNDLIDLGFNGVGIGVVLKELYKECLVNPAFNDKRRLIDKSRSFKGEKINKLLDKYKIKINNSQER